MKIRSSVTGIGLVALLGLVAIACGGGGGGGNSVDAASTIDAFESDCGRPGDPGNEIGVGKFCASLGDCSTTQEAPLCSTLGDVNTHFCTKTCQMTGPATQCGVGAECICDGPNRCGCTPSSCLTN